MSPSSGYGTDNITEAEGLGADAVINVRFVTTSVIGTAAKLR